ncbi:hypothetical protein GO308_06870 [Sphingomonas sp. SFZ2018-12]|uniref:hypothetical protein n=1 Tax=Sphingomonas sp. SFZ2018-12 TaxID=2683197 RepID=UPI001F104866|nr:hypothetical protein [Sphingomonas sp. SFZ2018-12]MCH4892829.1 hypothetical protein [Sphingomonas sp. SFZ2018-12]
MTAFREMSRDDIATFRDIAESVAAGHATDAEAEAQIAELGNALAAVWKWTNNNGTALSLILTILTIYLQITAGWEADRTAEKLRASVEVQTQVERMILNELQKSSAAFQAQHTLPPPKKQLLPPVQQKKPGQLRQNRHERRKAKAIARRRPSR